MMGLTRDPRGRRIETGDAERAEHGSDTRVGLFVFEQLVGRAIPLLELP